MTITFDEPVLLNELRVGSLSELGMMWEWIEVTGHSASGVVDHTSVGVSTSTYNTTGVWHPSGHLDQRWQRHRSWN